MPLHAFRASWLGIEEILCSVYSISLSFSTAISVLSARNCTLKLRHARKKEKHTIKKVDEKKRISAHLVCLYYNLRMFCSLGSHVHCNWFYPTHHKVPAASSKPTVCILNNLVTYIKIIITYVYHQGHANVNLMPSRQSVICVTATHIQTACVNIPKYYLVVSVDKYC